MTPRGKFRLLVGSLLVLGLIVAYNLTHVPPVGHRVPTQDWQLLAHYCCTAGACREHHLGLRWQYKANTP